MHLMLYILIAIYRTKTKPVIFINKLGTNLYPSRQKCGYFIVMIGAYMHQLVIYLIELLL